MTHILVDPGHGGRDTGAQIHGVYERDLNLSVALKLMRLIDAIPTITADITRRNNEDTISWARRTEIEKLTDPDFVLCIHTDIAEHAAQGAMGYWWPGNQTAGLVVQAIVDRAPDRLRRSRYQGFSADPGVSWLARARNVLGAYKASTALIEMGFLSDPDDLEALQDDAHQWAMAAAMLQGLTLLRMR